MKLAVIAARSERFCSVGAGRGDHV